MHQRAILIPQAKGDVLEIGAGSGLNLPFYDEKLVTQLSALDPSLETWNKRSVDVNKMPFGFDFMHAPAEHIPADSNRFDTVVMTYTLCSIADTEQALAEIRRVLKPGGKLLFCEHGKAPDKAVQHWQNAINPIWRRFGGGCNLNRDIPEIIGGNGFQIQQIEEKYIPGWKPASFNYWGAAGIG